MKTKEKILLLLILFFGFLLRIYNVNWDGGFHMHPDERAIVLFTLPLNFPTSLTQFLSAQSPWNPHFFAYGSLPIYLLKLMSMIAGRFDPLFFVYEKINLLGRVISAAFDTTTILIIFFLTKKIFQKHIAFLAAFFYSISVLSIQTSHFYAVDTILTCFILTTLFFLLKLFTKPTPGTALFVGIFFGLSLATKTSAIAVVAPIFITLCVDFILVFVHAPHKPHVWLPHIPIIIKRLATEGVIIALSSSIVFFICEPYAFLDFQAFTQQNFQQLAMTHDAFTFPYTLQYVGKTPYWYELKNIFLWGLGPVLGTLSYLGIFYITIATLKKHNEDTYKKRAQQIILIVFFWIYFAIVGKFAIGFMRYMLPLYTLLALFAAVFVYRIGLLLTNKYILTTYYLLLTTLLLIWPFSFLAIYSQTNTRIQATNWILQNIPARQTLAIEHWDDGLPLINQSQYRIQTLPLYDPDTVEKWQQINAQFNQTDYIIIASNRLYVPLQRLTNCATLPPLRCYPISAQYYKNLFSGNLGFKKVSQFHVYPTIPLLNIPIDDQSADESFTVYDHPKIFIFAKQHAKQQLETHTSY